MKIGIARGLLYSKYHVFAEKFFSELGAEIIVSPDTNKRILDDGVRLCIGDACLPVKVFHGHVSWLCGKCDCILAPRFMTLEKKKYICPMFCGLNDMLKSSISDMPRLIDAPVYSLDASSMSLWSKNMSRKITGSIKRVEEAFRAAVEAHETQKTRRNDERMAYKVALIGHSYNTDDAFVNMNLVKKLNAQNIGIVTSDAVSRTDILREAGSLFKAPFWYFAEQHYGAAVHLVKTRSVDGIVYVSSFSCGVDSVAVELIRNAVYGMPFMVLKIDEHTGEAAFNTRIEAFADMLKRRTPVGNNVSKNGQYEPCGQSIV